MEGLSVPLLRAGAEGRSPPFLDRVFALLHLLARIGCSLSRFNDTDGVQGAETHPTFSAVQHEPVKPGLRHAILASRHLQVQSGAVMMETRVARPVNLQSSQSVDLRHDKPIPYSRLYQRFS